MTKEQIKNQDKNILLITVDDYTSNGKSGLGIQLTVGYSKEEYKEIISNTPNHRQINIDEFEIFLTEDNLKDLLQLIKDK